MKWFLFFAPFLFCHQLQAQNIAAYDIGEPVELKSFIKEVIVWENGEKVDANTVAGQEVNIYLSNKLVRITETDSTYNYKIKEVRIDEFGTISFKAESETMLRFHKHRQLLQIEPEGNTEEILYYIEQ